MSDVDKELQEAVDEVGLEAIEHLWDEAHAELDAAVARGNELHALGQYRTIAQDEEFAEIKAFVNDHIHFCWSIMDAEKDRLDALGVPWPEYDELLRRRWSI
jgi:hypothetical protein